MHGSDTAEQLTQHYTKRIRRSTILNAMLIYQETDISYLAMICARIHVFHSLSNSGGKSVFLIPQHKTLQTQ